MLRVSFLGLSQSALCVQALAAGCSQIGSSCAVSPIWTQRCVSIPHARRNRMRAYRTQTECRTTNYLVGPWYSEHEALQGREEAKRAVSSMLEPGHHSC